MNTGLGPIKEPEPISIGDSLSWITRDPNWLIAVAIGSLWALATLFILPMVVVAGYGARVLKASFLDERATIPLWTPLGPLFSDGLRVLGVMAVHYLVAGAGLWALLSGIVFLGPPTDDTSSILFLIGVFLMATLGLVAAWLFGLYLLTAISRAIVLDRWAAAFEMAENLDCLRRNANNFGRFAAILIIVSTVFQLSPLLCCVGVFPAVFWMQCTMNHALGRVLASDPSFAVR